MWGALDDVARIYHQRLERSVDRLCTFATSVAELMLGLVVLGFALTYMLPVVHFSNHVFGR